MSRSYKKNPVTKDNGRSKKKAKQMCNRLFRRRLQRIDPEEEPYFYNNTYRKATNSWDICDYWHCGGFNSVQKMDWINERVRTSFFRIPISLKRAENNWRKWYKSK
jgi:hypothetical protein